MAWIGIILAATCVLNTIGLIALTLRIRYLENLMGDLIVEQIVGEAAYLAKTITNMKKENNNGKT